MKRYIIPILLGTIIFNGCRKDDNWPTAEERLNNGAKELFRKTVSEAVNAVEVCEAFQDYLDAPGDDKILDKYKDIFCFDTSSRLSYWKRRKGTFSKPNEIKVKSYHQSKAKSDLTDDIVNSL